MTIAVLSHVTHGDEEYDALTFWCPGCERIDDEGGRHGGLHSLPVTPTTKSPVWAFDGNLEAPTLTPSILSRRTFKDEPEFVCHSYLRAGALEFLGDSTHQYAGQTIPLPDLPDWAVA